MGLVWACVLGFDGVAAFGLDLTAGLESTFCDGDFACLAFPALDLAFALLLVFALPLVLVLLLVFAAALAFADFDFFLATMSNPPLPLLAAASHVA